MPRSRPRRRFGWLMAAELRAGRHRHELHAVRGSRPRPFRGDRRPRAARRAARGRGARAPHRRRREDARGWRPRRSISRRTPARAATRTRSSRSTAASYEALADDLLPYRELIANGLQAVMVAHVSFPAVDETPASLSKWWIEDQLARRARVLRRRDHGRREHGRRGRSSARSRSACGARSKRAAISCCSATRRTRFPACSTRCKGYVNPAAQLRLTRLHGRGGADWERLHASAEWRKAQRRSSRRFARAPRSSSKVGVAATSAAERDAQRRRAARGASIRRATSRARSTHGRARSRRGSHARTRSCSPSCTAARSPPSSSASASRFPHEFDYVHVTRYANGTRGRRRSSGASGRARASRAERCSSSTTCSTAATRCARSHAELERVGVAERHDRGARREEGCERKRARPRVDYVGVDVDDVYVFGCGMDYRGYWRGLPASTRSIRTTCAPRD